MNNNFSVYDKFIKSHPTSIKNLEDFKKYYGFDLYSNREFKRKRLQNPDGYIELSYIYNDEDKYIDQDSWKYIINPWNFRDHWNFDDNRSKIGFFGCSFTFGEGIDSIDTFVDIVSKKFNLNPFNFGIGGASIERIARTVSAVVNLIDIEYAVITLPSCHRTLYIDDTGSMINFLPSSPPSKFVRLSKQLTSLDDDFYIIRALSSVNWIYDVLNKKNIKFLISSWDYPLNYLCKKIFPLHTLDPFPIVDDKQARDRLHPGIKSQQAHADQIIKAFFDKNWV